MIKEHEKMISFVFILAAICWLAWMASGEQTFVMVEGKPVSIAAGSPLRDVLIGLIGVLGMAGQALFRTSETAGTMNDLLKSAVEHLSKSAPTLPQDPNTSQNVTITNDAGNPVPVEEQTIADPDTFKK